MQRTVRFGGQYSSLIRDLPPAVLPLAAKTVPFGDMAELPHSLAHDPGRSNNPTSALNSRYLAVTPNSLSVQNCTLLISQILRPGNTTGYLPANRNHRISAAHNRVQIIPNKIAEDER